MTHIARSIIIDAPVSEVFDYASQWTRWEDWFEGVSGFRSLSEIEKGNGAKFAYRARMMGVAMPLEAEIYDFVRNEGWASRGTKGMPYISRWIFREKGDRTEFTYELDYEFRIPVIGKLLDRKFVIPEWENILERSLLNLKHIFEKASA